MHPLLRNMLTKAADLGAMFGVVRRMTGNKRLMFRSMQPMSGSMNPMSGDMAEMSDNKGLLSCDISAKSCDTIAMPYDIEAMADNYAEMSRVSLLKSLNPLTLLLSWAALLRYEISEWYYRKMGLSDPVLRKFYREAEWDDLFVVVSIESHVRSHPRFHRRWEPMPPVVHELLYFLIVDKPVRRDPKKLLAVLLAFARIVLGLTEHKEGWTLPSQLALQSGSGSGPLSPRPPPFAVC